jgi:hypothetical protein
MEQCRALKRANQEEHVTNDHASSLLSELAEMHQSFLSILRARGARFEEHRQLVRSMVHRLHEQKEILREGDGLYVSFKKPVKQPRRSN